ncbi:MAG: S1C family serine protease [Puniceicoccaceae bacterium]
MLWKSLLIAGSAGLISISQVRARSVVSLQGDFEIKGEILAERADRVVVDLGIGVLEVPRSAILSIQSEEQLGETDDAGLFSGGLLRKRDSRESRSVADWATEVGGAVVLVRTPVGLGSGFIIDPRGYVITNDHVIAGETRVDVTVFREEGGGLQRVVYERAEILANSPEMDLALLKLDPKKEESFPFVPIGESVELTSGDSVFAIGSPLGLERSVSQGIVSLRNRLISSRVYIQTTAEISPGNSGGPLFNRFGEVVGINNMKVVGMGAEGLGFAIPVEVLKQFIRNRDAYSFNPSNPNEGYRYTSPPTALRTETSPEL